MAKLLRNLIGGREPTFSLRLRSLEAATGHNKLDLQLLSDVITKTKQKTKQLGLDPRDTTPAELYTVLIKRALGDDAELASAYKGDAQKMIDRLNQKAPIVQIPVIKSVVLKKLIAENPPKKVLSTLGFRSAESLLKRVPLEQLLIGAFLQEPISWHRNFAKKLKSLSSSDMTMQKPKVYIIDKRLMDGARFKQIVSLQCAGLVGVPRLAVWPGSYLLTAALAAEGLFHLHARGVLLKLIRFNDQCIKDIAHYTYAAPSPVGEIGRIGIPWLSVYAHVSDHKSLLEAASEGTVEANDFFWREPGEVLPFLSQRVDFWATSFLGQPHEITPLSLNLSDIAHNAYNHVPLTHGICNGLRRSLGVELMARYFGHCQNKKEIMTALGIIS